MKKIHMITGIYKKNGEQEELHAKYMECPLQSGGDHMTSLSLKEYYLWADKKFCPPWQRQYLNTEFLNYERTRIVNTHNWHEKAKRGGFDNDLDEISFYVVPVLLSTSWKAAVAQSDCIPVGLSVLSNSLQEPTIGLIPYGVRQPREYKLILITKSRLKRIINERSKRVHYALLINEWEYLDSDYIYRDIPYEKRSISKIIAETLIGDEHLCLSFQSPILSAPYDGALGGVSLSSLSGDSSFAKQLVKTIQCMVPPEYRTIPPPKRVYKGSTIPYTQGIDYHLAERPYPSSNIVSSLCPKKYERIDRELLKRRKFTGEFSIFSTLNPVGRGMDAWKELMLKFSNTEITLPEKLDTLIEADVNLKRLEKAINEDLWLQIVHARQFMPGIDTKTDEELMKTVILLKTDFDVLLSEYHKNERDREYLVRSFSPGKYNVKRIAQSFARSDERDAVTAVDFKSARNLIIDNFTGFVENPDFDRMRWKMKESKANARFLIVQTELINNPRSKAADIFERIKSENQFKDMYDLQGLLDWMKDKGLVIVSGDNRYTWA